MKYNTCFKKLEEDNEMLFTISPLFIYKSCILYLVLPIIFFFIGWLRIGIGILLSSLLLLSSYFFIKKIKELIAEDAVIVLSKEYFFTFIILFLFLLSTGNTGFIGSWGVDIPWRNAIYQDLIRYSWPVIYDYSHSMLCYYMMFWLVPAKITALLGLNEVGSNVILFIWMYIGLLLVFFLLCNILRVDRNHVIYIAILFLFFSGINTIGMLIKSIFINPDPLIGDVPGRLGWSFADYDINGMRSVYIIRSVFLCIADVYNQFFAIAISTFLFLRFKMNVDCIAFIGLLALPYSPIGFIGFFIVVLFQYLVTLLNGKNESLMHCFRSFFSLTNILSILAIIPVFYLYFSMNVHASSLLTKPGSSNVGFLYVALDQYNIFRVAMLIVYYISYFGLYTYLLFPYYKKSSLYWSVIFCLLVFPFFKIGGGEDFNYNATICPFLILFTLIAEILINMLKFHQVSMRGIVLTSLLSIAMLTPIIQISTAFRAAYLYDVPCYKWNAWDINLKQDSFADKNINGFSNFLSNAYDKSLFFRYCAKKT